MSDKLSIVLLIALTIIGLFEAARCGFQRTNKFARREPAPIRFDLLRNRLKPGQIILDGPELTNYYSHAYVGNPPQHLKVSFDPGYPLTWLLSSNCTNMGSEFHNHYNSSSSTTYRANGKSIKFTWGINNMKSILSTDNIRLGDLELENFTFGELVEEDGDFLSENIVEGVIGLGLPNEKYPKTIIQSLYEQKLIPSPIVSIYLNRKESSLPRGEVMFGGVNKKYFTGDITYTPTLSSSGTWQINIEKLAVNFGGKERYVTCANGCRANIDFSASNFIAGPADIIAEINNNIGATPHPFGGWAIDCELQELSDVVIKLGGREFVLTPGQYVFPIQNTCYTAFQNNYQEGGETDWILSYPLMGPLYTVFDHANKRVGFAESLFD